MTDKRLRAICHDKGLTASVAVVTGTAREGQKMHGLHDMSAMLLAQAMAAGALLVSLQKDASRINLQLECDGPLRGMFVDAGADGSIRGYVKNPYLDVEGNRGPMRWRPALGNKGFFSVLKDVGDGDFYRSSIELAAMDPALDLERYFTTSEQVQSKVALAVERSGEEPLGVVAGVLIQALPHGDLTELQRIGASLTAELERHVKGKLGVEAEALLSSMLPGFEPMSQTPVAWRCTCSKDRVLVALSAMGKAELQDILTTQGEAAATCQFCSRRHVASADDLKALLNGFS